jgi:fructan beta-fructosidase
LFSCKKESRDNTFVVNSSEPLKNSFKIIQLFLLRPQFHFTPKKKWMNDPNGMVYYKADDQYLFYQYYPDDIVLGTNAICN